MNLYDSEPISQLPPIVSVSFIDSLPIVDVSDQTESPSGTTKKVTIAQLQDFIESANPWVTVTSGPVTLIANQGYIIDTPALGLLYLPVSAEVGDQYYIEGLGVNLFKINQNSGQQIIFGDQQSTVGPGGYLQSTDSGDSLTLICVVANTVFKVRSTIGNIFLI